VLHNSKVEDGSDFWSSRDVDIPPRSGAPAIRVAIWDSGVDTALFSERLAVDLDGRPLVRGYDSFKRRQDTPMAVLPASYAARHEELNSILMAFDDIDGGVDSPAAKALTERIESLSPSERDQLTMEVGRWSGYAHGTAVADIALAGHSRAEIIVARMEWWHGSPPVPPWSHELARREADSIRDLLGFVVESGARVVNMSWGRFEGSYLTNLEQSAPDMPLAERQALARETVEMIRLELREGMAAAPKVLFVGAAGNDGKRMLEANPATRFSLPNFLLVGAVDRTGSVADYTNTGPEVTLYANGERVPARLPGGLPSFASGTSMAAPNVSNAAAKVLATDARLSGAELRALLEETADTNSTGQRLLHTARAVEVAQAATYSNPEPTD